jgi:transcriptional regulator with XRE-family HTH domain
MAIGERMRAIRLQHGHSLDQASAITGINRSTLHRLEQGESPRGIMEHVRRFCAGYGVAEKVLLDGETLKGRFESYVRKQDASGRLSLATRSVQERLRIAFDFVTCEQPELASNQRLAIAGGLPVSDVQQALRLLRIRPVDHATLVALVDGLHSITGISKQFLLTGWFEEEIGLRCLIEPLMNHLKGVPGPKGVPSTSDLIQQLVGALLA